jgi:putative ATP-binding cassette transporter
VLWSISGALTVPLGQTEIVIPGYMVWAAVGYALVGSLLTHWVGRRLVGLNFQQERYEADFRFGLVRLREHAEGVALYGGEEAERLSLLGRFDRIRGNWRQLMRYTVRLTTFTVGYNQIAIIFPILVAAPQYFAGAITLGGLMQISSAFGRVQDALSWFVNSYDGLAPWKASVDRLVAFNAALDRAGTTATGNDRIAVAANGASGLRADAIDLALPSGRILLAGVSLDIAPGDRVLLQGPSGSGKSTLFRAMAGIWPFGRGTIHVPADARTLFLPQKPYIPLLSLRDAVAYPAPGGSIDDDAVREALIAVGLATFVFRLNETRNWSLELSGGEQQRLAVARALLHRPDWLFLDEATSALDPVAEEELHAALRQRLPHATIVSVAHHPEATGYYDRTIELAADRAQPELVTA